MLQLQQFWNWFVENEATYYGLHRMALDDKTYHFERLCLYLKDFHPDLGVIVAGPRDLGKATLTFTANGRPDGFIHVRNLVDHAPSLPRWDVVAFVQPRPDIDDCVNGTDDPYQFHRMPLKASEVFWLPLEPDEGDTSGKLDIVLGFKGFDESVKGLGFEQVEENLFTIVIDLMGELELQRYLGQVHLEEWDPNRNYLELYDILSYIDAYYR